jgi:uncharacterized membrane protein YkvI
MLTYERPRGKFERIWGVVIIAVVLIVLAAAAARVVHDFNASEKGTIETDRPHGAS